MTHWEEVLKSQGVERGCHNLRDTNHGAVDDDSSEVGRVLPYKEARPQGHMTCFHGITVRSFVL